MDLQLTSRRDNAGKRGRALEAAGWHVRRAHISRTARQSQAHGSLASKASTASNSSRRMPQPPSGSIGQLAMPRIQRRWTVADRSPSSARGSTKRFSCRRGEKPLDTQGRRLPRDPAASAAIAVGAAVIMQRWRTSPYKLRVSRSVAHPRGLMEIFRPLWPHRVPSASASKGSNTPELCREMGDGV